MDRKSIIGFILLAVLFYVWMTLNQNNNKKIQAEKKLQDSVMLSKITQQKADSLKALEALSPRNDSAGIKISDTSSIVKRQPPAEVTLENDLIALTVSNVGAKIKQIHLKQYKTSAEDAKGNEVREPLLLQEAPENEMVYILPLANGSKLETVSLPSTVEKSGDKIILKTELPNQAFLEQSYQFDTAAYQIDYQAKIIGDPGLDKSKPITVRWVNNLTRLEKNYQYERTYSTLYFKIAGESSDHTSYSKNTTVKLKPGQQLEWLSAVNQFFNSSWVPEKPFDNAELTITQGEGEDKYLKKTEATVTFPIEFSSGQSFGMKVYAGPNEFNRLREYNNSLEDIIPFGSSIMGSINKWVVRPLFNFLGTFISSKGLVILMLTLLVKLALWPLTYKMI